MTQVRGILLDVDGTLVDSNDAHAHAWLQALAESGTHVSFERVRRLIGKGGDKLLPEVSGIDPQSSQGKTVKDRRAAIFREKHLPTLRPCNGAEALLRELHARDFRLAVASSAKKGELDSAAANLRCGPIYQGRYVLG